MMDFNDLVAVAQYISEHPGCSEAEISAGCPSVNGLHGLLEEAVSGVNPEDGLIFRRENGSYYLGPEAHFVNNQED